MPASLSPLSANAMAVRRYDRERFVTALFAPPPVREDLFALYAFNQEVARVRELVSEPLLGQIRLQWWREGLERLSTGAGMGHPVGDALGAAIRRHDLPGWRFERLLAARELDLRDSPPAGLAELEAYVADTSAELSVLALAVVGVREEAAETAARHVGIAWGLTGLLRAVPFHATARRIYLPTGLLVEHAVSAEDVLAGRRPPGLAAVGRTLADRALFHLAAARRLRRQVPPAALPVLLSARLADGYLAALRQSGHDLTDRTWSRVNTRPAVLAMSTLFGRF